MLIVVAIILIVMARVASRRGNRVSVRGTADGAIVAVVFAIMLTVAALLISNLFKDGIVKPVIARQVTCSECAEHATIS